MYQGLKGQVVRFDPRRGYGFITILNGALEGEQAFVHQNDIVMEGFRSLQQGEEVNLNVEENEKGWKALDVHLVHERQHRPPPRPMPPRPSGMRGPPVDKGANARINRLEKIIDRLLEVLTEHGDDVDAILNEDDIDFIRNGREEEELAEAEAV